MVKGPEHMHKDNRLRELSLFSMAKRKLRCYITAIYSYLKWYYKFDGVMAIKI